MAIDPSDRAKYAKAATKTNTAPQRYRAPANSTRPPVVRDSYTISPAASNITPITNDGGGGGGGGQNFFGGGGLTAPSVPNEIDWLSGDSGYQSQLAALMKSLQGSNTELDRNLQTYDQDYRTALGSLGWGDVDPLTDGDQLDWNTKDLNTSVGRGRKAVTDDFSGRGALQSSHYVRAIENLMRSIEDQKTSMDTGALRFRNDIAAQRSAFTDENTAAQGSARRESLARRALGYTSV